MGGVAGFDMGAVFALADALGYGRAGVAALIGFAEAGMLAAVNRDGG